MGVRPAYRKSDVGVIPRDWEVIPVGSIASFKSGVGVKITSLRGQSPDTPVPVYGGNGIAGYTTRALVHRQMVVVGRVGQKCGEVYLTDGPAWITDNALYPRTFFRDVDVRYFALALQGAGLNALKNRNDLPLITQSILHSVSVSLPSNRAEQEAIAEVLGNADALVESLEQLLDKKRQLKQGVMQALLTGKRRLPGFSGEWEPKRLGDIGRFLKGSGVARVQSNTGDVPCVRYGELYTRHNDYIRKFYSWISDSVAAGATRLRKGDILFAGSGETKEEIGKSAAFVDDAEAYAGGDIVILRPEDADSHFLGYYLNTKLITRQKASRGQGDAVVHISSASLADIQIELPLVPEQSAIALVLVDIDAEIDALEAKLTKARQVKQGMMQELLTGRIRLV